MSRPPTRELGLAQRDKIPYRVERSSHCPILHPLSPQGTSRSRWSQGDREIVPSPFLPTTSTPNLQVRDRQLHAMQSIPKRQTVFSANGSTPPRPSQS